MVAITNTTSLTFLKEAIDSTLTEAETRLEAFSDDNALKEELEHCATAFQQLRGICQVVELPAAALMSEEMALAARELLEKVSESRIQALGNAIVLLTRYFDYVQLKNRTLPSLLIGGINELRRAGGKPLIQESHFFSADLSRQRNPEAPDTEVSRDELAALSRRLRHMYQVGLVGILREQNPPTHLKLMARAMARLDKAAGPCGLSRFFWVGQAALMAMAADEMALTPARKALLSQYDRQLKKVVYDGGQALDENAPLLLLKESLYLVSLSAVQDGVIGQVKQVFDLKNAISDTELQRELSLMTGASGSVIRSVASAMRDEIGELKQTLDLASQGVADTNYEAVADSLSQLGSTLSMIGKDDDAAAIKDRSAQVRQWPADQSVETDAFHALVDDLLRVENVAANLERSLAPEDDVHKASNNTAISLYQLDEARMTVVGECRAGLALAKRSISSFMDNNWDAMHLSNLPGTFASIAGGLMFLELQRAKGVTEACHQYIRKQLIEGETAPTRENMETLADALTGVDYYLESMEEQKPIGEGVLEVAEESMKALGYPVDKVA
ncbi:MAG: hypothetical protein CL537_02145 [Alcanivoracaceae bacterium]|uniref:hypothetical protein n=1 Tax=Alcanivorax sp. MD8A TaxID=1177157 RepID=UPI000C44B3F6|nr:hypothetical protein [Alcanivorax sp. MD8A]MAX54310.1 hypothetical protein [Alcanivoracaceae bacterium]MCG8436718.1 hypothetical protein [Pseudomonadales bacterium]MEE2869356.1 hypothetical protein [Pseudomonadota bacterium]PNE03429.1 hypothetical protein A15D_00897 [Alcanivorax sp. MD8A]|tara:strand:- start:3650 stop:5329 length:1680 start_codon:yes stop_codon:yes gene_type:complete